MTVRTWSEDLPVTQVYYNSTIMMVFFSLQKLVEKSGGVPESGLENARVSQTVFEVNFGVNTVIPLLRHFHFSLFCDRG